MDPIEEKDLTLPILKMLAAAPDGFLETSELIDKLEDEFQPTGVDAQTLRGRHDSHFSQKVRNVISHRASATNPIAKGWIEYNEQMHGLRITEAGSAKL